MLTSASSPSCLWAAPPLRPCSAEAAPLLRPCSAEAVRFLLVRQRGTGQVLDSGLVLVKSSHGVDPTLAFVPSAEEVAGALAKERAPHQGRPSLPGRPILSAAAAVSSIGCWVVLGRRVYWSPRSAASLRTRRPRYVLTRRWFISSGVDEVDSRHSCAALEAVADQGLPSLDLAHGQFFEIRACSFLQILVLACTSVC